MRLASRAVLAVVMLVMLVVEIANPTTPVKENYAAAAAYLNTHTTMQDAVVFSAPFTIYPVEYYYTGPSPLATLPVWNQYAYGPIPGFDATKLPAEVASSTNDAQNVYVLLSYDQGYEKNIKDYFDAHYQQILSINFSQDLNLYEYRLRYDTGVTAAK